MSKLYRIPFLRDAVPLFENFSRQSKPRERIGAKTDPLRQQADPYKINLSNEKGVRDHGSSD